jgi:hypothetical protein
VLRNCRPGGLEMPGDLACRKFSALGQQLDDLSPIRLRYGRESIHGNILRRILI